MKNERSAALAAPPQFNSAKVRHIQQVAKVLAYFCCNVGTPLECARAMHISRNNIVYCLAELEVLGLLRPVGRRPNTITGYHAKLYSADPAQWQATDEPQRTEPNEEKGGSL